MSRRHHAHTDDHVRRPPSTAAQTAGLGLFQPPAASPAPTAAPFDADDPVLRRRVLRAIVHSRGMGLTADQAAAWLEAPPAVVTACCTALLQAGHIADSGRRAAHDDGALAPVFVATVSGEHEAERQEDR